MRRHGFLRGPATPTERRTLALQRDAAGAGRGDRVHTVVRWWSCPFPAVEAEVPASGRVLEVGCGHGLLSMLLALGSPDRAVTGIDIDAHKIERARAAAAGLRADEARPTFDVASLEEVAATGERWDAIVVADVLYLLDPATRRHLLATMASAVAPGGVVVVKECVRTPRWKCRLATLQERLATGALGITTGATIDFPSGAELAEPLVAAGLEVGRRRVDRGYPWAHHLVVGRAAAPVSAGRATEGGAS